MNDKCLIKYNKNQNKILLKSIFTYKENSNMLFCNRWDVMLDLFKKHPEYNDEKTICFNYYFDPAKNLWALNIFKNKAYYNQNVIYKDNELVNNDLDYVISYVYNILDVIK